MPGLMRMKFVHCVFAGDGEGALPGMDTLVSLTSLRMAMCLSLRVLTASLWRLSQLRCLGRHLHHMAGMPRSELPTADLLAGGAPCLACLSHMTLMSHDLPAFPPCILDMMRHAHDPHKS